MANENRISYLSLQFQEIFISIHKFRHNGLIYLTCVRCTSILFYFNLYNKSYLSIHSSNKYLRTYHVPGCVPGIEEYSSKQSMHKPLTSQSLDSHGMRDNRQNDCAKCILCQITVSAIEKRGRESLGGGYYFTWNDQGKIH